MPRPSFRALAFLAWASSLGLLASTAPARADDYTELRDILRAKGSLTKGEYGALLSHHLRRLRSGEEQDRGGAEGERPRRARPRRVAEGTTGAPDVMTIATAAAARRAADEAAASARDTRALLARAQEDYHPESIVRFKPYVAARA